MTQHTDTFLSAWAENVSLLMLRPDLQNALFVGAKLAVAAGKDLNDPAVRKDVMTEAVALDMLEKGEEPETHSVATEVAAADVNSRLADDALIFGYVPCGADYEPCADIVYVEAPDEREAFELMQVWIEIGKIQRSPFYQMIDVKEPIADGISPAGVSR
jgi:hypothetical protein